MKFCIFEAPSKKILYFLGYIVFAYIRELFEYLLNDIFKRKEAQFFEFAFFYTIGDLICGLFVLIINKRTDSIKIDVNENSKNDLKYTSTMKNSLIFNDSQSNLKYLSLKRVLYLSIYDLLAQSCIVIYFFIYANDGTKIQFNNLNLTLIVDITSRFILHKIRLGMKFYSHFYLSITLNILSFFILSISDIYFLNYSNDKKKNWVYLGLTIISTILYSFENVEGKIGLNIEFLNVYSLIFYKGIIQSSFLIIIAIIVISLKQYDLFTAFYDNDYNIFFTIIVIFLYLMFNLFTNICIWKIVDIYSIQHLTIAKGGSSFIFYIISLIKGRGINYPNNMNILYFTDIFGFILLFIGTLIHNEIIILNCCGLNMHTRKKLLERAETDLKMAKNNESLDSSYETKDMNDSDKKIEVTQSYKETYNTISELSEHFVPED